jgi:hypothetical protein
MPSYEEEDNIKMNQILLDQEWGLEKGRCEHSSKTSGSINGKKLLD